MGPLLILTDKEAAHKDQLGLAQHLQPLILTAFSALSCPLRLFFFFKKKKLNQTLATTKHRHLQGRSQEGLRGGYRPPHF